MEDAAAAGEEDGNSSLGYYKLMPGKQFRERRPKHQPSQSN